MLNKRLSKSILGCWPKSDRLLIVKLKASPFNINMFVAYAPTTDTDDRIILWLEWMNCTATAHHRKQIF